MFLSGTPGLHHMDRYQVTFFTRDLGDFLLSHADSTYISVLQLVSVSFSVLKSLADYLTLMISKLDSLLLGLVKLEIIGYLS